MHPHDPCTDFRRAHVADPRSLAPTGFSHGATCEACRAWLDRRGRAVQVIATLDRVSAPAALDRRVAEDVALARLARLTAPAVLDRLVAEELAAGPRAPIARAVTALPRTEAPVDLDRRIVGLLEGRVPTRTVAGRRPGLHRALASSLLAAAALFFAASVDLGSDDPVRPRPRLELVLVSSPSEIDPLAAGLLNGLRGAPISDPALARKGSAR